MDFGALVNVFGVTGALLASAVIAFYFEGVVSGPTHRRMMDGQEKDHERELTDLKLQYDARLAEKDRIIAEKTQDGREWRDLYRRVLSTLERQTNVSQDAVTIAKPVAGVEPESPSV